MPEFRDCAGETDTYEYKRLVEGDICDAGILCRLIAEVFTLTYECDKIT